MSGEVAYAKQQSVPALHLAARHAAKEAVVKALGLDGFDPLDVEVLADGNIWVCGSTAGPPPVRTSWA